MSATSGSKEVLQGEGNLDRRIFTAWCVARWIMVCFSPDTKEFQGRSSTFFHHEGIKNIATKYNATPAQVVLSWGIQRKMAVIPKSEDEQRLKDNITVILFWHLFPRLWFWFASIVPRSRSGRCRVNWWDTQRTGHAQVFVVSISHIHWFYHWLVIWRLGMEYDFRRHSSSQDILNDIYTRPVTFASNLPEPD